MSRTPFRVSFFGGGTDYPIWYKENGGAVLATTINKYCYISCRILPPFFEHKSRIIYSKIEQPNSIDEIKHPSVRETLRFMKVNQGVEIHHDGDLPARSGLGSSSSFTVGLLNALYAFQGRMASKMDLAMDAIKIEQNMIKENVGSQDQVLAAYGGFNRIDFSGGDNEIKVTPLIMKKDRLHDFQNNLMLFFTGLSRQASVVAKEQIKETPKKKTELKALHQMVDEATQILNSETNLSAFGKLLHEGWKIKRTLSKKITSDKIDGIMETALSAGALGGKIIGAGGGGFLLLFVAPGDQPKVREHLKGLLEVPFRFGSTGSEIIFYDRDEA